jgi:glutamate racemase
MQKANPIGIFDSGYGGLTVLKEIINKLPGYDYIYLGDNARAPYGNRSFETVYHYTLQCVKWFFEQGCSLVNLACNTASAKVLRSIQQVDLPGHPARSIAKRHKTALERHLASLFERAGVASAKVRAREIWLLSEGAMVLVMIHGDRSYIRVAAEAARTLLSGRKKR